MNYLSDYIFSDTLRYEAHRIVCTPAEGEPVVLTGFLGAATLAALLVDTPEGDARGIAVDTEEQRNEFYDRYEREVRRENGGLFTTEVQSLGQNYIELTGADGLLFEICGNDRLYDLAMRLMVGYMQRLVREEVHDSIYEALPWREPFAQWLYEAGFRETRRQCLLTVDWSNEAEVYAFAKQLENSDKTEGIEPFVGGETGPTFLFDGLSAEEIINGYWNWLWEAAQQSASLYPDRNVQLAKIMQDIRENEFDYDFLKPEMKHFSPDQIRLFRNWMTQWKDFLEKKLPPEMIRKMHIEQELFLDSVLPVPHENKYTEVREYINERKKYDKNFKEFCQTRKRTVLCEQLSLMFGWAVDDNALGKSMRRQLKYPKKNLLK